MITVLLLLAITGSAPPSWSLPCATIAKRIGKKVLIDGPANIRASPSSSATVVWRAPDGQDLRVIAAAGSWFEVEDELGENHDLKARRGWTAASNIQPICHVAELRCAKVGGTCKQEIYQESLPRKPDGHPAVTIGLEAGDFQLTAFGHKWKVGRINGASDHYLFMTDDDTYPFGYYVQPGDMDAGALLIFGTQGIRQYQPNKSIAGTFIRTVTVDGQARIQQQFACMPLTSTLSFHRGGFTRVNAKFDLKKFRYQTIVKSLNGQKCIMRLQGSKKPILLNPGDKIELLGLCADEQTVHVKRMGDGKEGCVTTDVSWACFSDGSHCAG